MCEECVSASGSYPASLLALRTRLLTRPVYSPRPMHSRGGGERKGKKGRVVSGGDGGRAVVAGLSVRWMWEVVA